MLQDIATGLGAAGLDVTDPKPGKACQAICAVRFRHVNVSLVLLVRRHNGRVGCQLLTWPFQKFAQRFSRRLKSSGDCKEWSHVCAILNDILVHDQRLRAVRSLTFSEGEAVPGWN